MCERAINSRSISGGRRSGVRVLARTSSSAGRNFGAKATTEGRAFEEGPRRGGRGCAILAWLLWGGLRFRRLPPQVFRLLLRDLRARTRRRRRIPKNERVAAGGPECQGDEFSGFRSIHTRLAISRWVRKYKYSVLDGDGPSSCPQLAVGTGASVGTADLPQDETGAPRFFFFSFPSHDVPRFVYRERSNRLVGIRMKLGEQRNPRR